MTDTSRAICGDPPPPPFDLPLLMGPGVQRNPWITNAPTLAKDIPPAKHLLSEDLYDAGALLAMTADSARLALAPDDLRKPRRPVRRSRLAGVDRVASQPANLSWKRNPSNPSDPLLGPISYQGINQGAGQMGRKPVPDPHGGVGTEYFLEITNIRIRIFDKYSGEIFPTNKPAAPTHDEALEAFFAEDPNIPTESLSDPRAIKDPETGRWIAVALGNHLSGTALQNFYITVSATADARRDWIAFPPQAIPLQTAYDADYPFLGVDGKAVNVTLNVGPEHGGFTSTFLFSFNKNVLFNGSDMCVNRITTLPPFVTPPIVRDGNGTSFFVAPYVRQYGMDVPARSIRMWSGSNLGDTYNKSFVQLPDAQFPASEPGYFRPAPVRQCAPPDLDPFEGRFINASTQVGRWLWQAHTISASETDTHATPRWYEFDLSTATTSQPARINRTGRISLGGGAYDWNISIVADDEEPGGGSVAFANWSSSNPSASPCRSPEIRYGGVRPVAGDSFNANPVLAAGSDLTGTASSSGVPWGDYSSITIDPTEDANSLIYPACPHRAWLVNELGAGTQWRTWWGAVGLC